MFISDLVIQGSRQLFVYEIPTLVGNYPFNRRVFNENTDIISRRYKLFIAHLQALTTNKLKSCDITVNFERKLTKKGTSQ